MVMRCIWKGIFPSSRVTFLNDIWCFEYQQCIWITHPTSPNLNDENMYLEQVWPLLSVAQHQSLNTQHEDCFLMLENAAQYWLFEHWTWSFSNKITRIYQTPPPPKLTRNGRHFGHPKPRAFFFHSLMIFNKKARGSELRSWGLQGMDPDITPSITPLCGKLGDGSVLCCQHHIYMYTCIYIYMYIYLYILLFMYWYILCLCVYIYIYICMYV